MIDDDKCHKSDFDNRKNLLNIVGFSVRKEKLLWKT